MPADDRVKAQGLPQQILDQANHNLLRIYAYFRFLLAALLLAAYASDMAPDILGREQPSLFFYTALLYTTLNAFTIFFFGRLSFTPKTHQIFFVLLADIFAITLLMESSGGIQSGLGFLLVVCVAAGSLFMAGQLALLLAATASVCVMISSIAGLVGDRSATNTIFQSGLLGGLLFLTALIFQLLTRRLRTAQQDAQDKARSAKQFEQLNEHIVRRMRTGIIVIDEEGTIQLANTAATQLLGGGAMTNIVTPGRNIEEVRSLHSQLKRWQTYPWLRTAPFKERGSSLEVQANFTTLESDEGNQTLIFLEDTRALSQHAQQIKQVSLSRLTGSIAHEIRNPLGAISHAAQLLDEDPTMKQQSRVIQIIKKQSDRVNQLIENVTQLSRRQTPEMQKLELNSWLKLFIAEYQNNCQQPATIELASNNGNGACRVIFDPSHLSQVLTNLLDNALRHSQRQSGTAWAQLKPYIHSDSGHPYLDVLDNGAGVSDDEQEKIFEPFFTTHHEGSGLGLYLSRELCQLNFSTLNYVEKDGDANHCFRIGFAHPDRLLPGQR